MILSRAEGNPFFLEESVRTLVETKVLAGERGNYHLEKKVESIQVPATVQAVLAARIDRLPPQEKQLLQSAAVIGKDVSIPLLLAIADAPEPEVRAELIRAIDALRRPIPWRDDCGSGHHAYRSPADGVAGAERSRSDNCGFSQPH